MQIEIEGIIQIRSCRGKYSGKVITKVRTKAEEYGANPDMVEALYREMISRFVSMEIKEFNERNNH